MGRTTKVTVFEASNESRREVYIATTTLSMNALITRLGQRRPAALRHWRPAEPVRFRSLEFGMAPADAAAYIRGYASGRSGWRVIRARKALGAPKGGSR